MVPVPRMRIPELGMVLVHSRSAAVGPAPLCCSRNPQCQFQQVPGPGGSFPAVRLCNSYWSRKVQGRERGVLRTWQADWGGFIP